MKKVFLALAITLSVSAVNAQNSSTYSETTKTGTITEISSDLSSGVVIETGTGRMSDFVNPSSAIVNVGDKVTYLEIKGRSIPENSIEFLKGRSIPENSIEMIANFANDGVLNIILNKVPQ